MGTGEAQRALGQLRGRPLHRQVRHASVLHRLLDRSGLVRPSVVHTRTKRTLGDIWIIVFYGPFVSLILRRLVESLTDVDVRRKLYGLD